MLVLSGSEFSSVRFLWPRSPEDFVCVSTLIVIGFPICFCNLKRYLKSAYKGDGFWGIEFVSSCLRLWSWLNSVGRETCTINSLHLLPSHVQCYLCAARGPLLVFLGSPAQERFLHMLRRGMHPSPFFTQDPLGTPHAAVERA